MSAAASAGGEGFHAQLQPASTVAEEMSKAVSTVCLHLVWPALL